MQQEIWKRCKNYHDKIIAIRRDIHMHPEIEFDLSRTAGVVVRELRKLPLEVRENVAKSGIVADLKVGNAKKTIVIPGE